MCHQLVPARNPGVLIKKGYVVVTSPGPGISYQLVAQLLVANLVVGMNLIFGLVVVASSY